MTTTSVKTLTSSVSTQTQPASGKLPLRGIAWSTVSHTFIRRANDELSMSIVLCEGARAPRSFRAEHVKCAKMAPVAMSKLIFVKTTQTGIWAAVIYSLFFFCTGCLIRAGRLWQIRKCSDVVLPQPSPGIHFLLLPRTCSMTRDGSRSRRGLSRGGSTMS